MTDTTTDARSLPDRLRDAADAIEEYGLQMGGVNPHTAVYTATGLRKAATQLADAAECAEMTRLIERVIREHTYTPRMPNKIAEALMAAGWRKGQ